MKKNKIDLPAILPSIRSKLSRPPREIASQFYIFKSLFNVFYILSNFGEFLVIIIFACDVKIMNFFLYYAYKSWLEIIA